MFYPGLNWRAYNSNTCTEYKVISKCLTHRLNIVLQEIVHKDQSYCIKYLYITDNLHLIKDVWDFTHYNNSFIWVCYQEKAFDRVDHVFLFDTLKTFGFGDNFISNIQLLYTEVTCKIRIAGGLSILLRVKGIRQGCPLSGQLYSIVIEPLLCK